MLSFTNFHFYLHYTQKFGFIDNFGFEKTAGDAIFLYFSYFVRHRPLLHLQGSSQHPGHVYLSKRMKPELMANAPQGVQGVPSEIDCTTAEHF